MSDKFIGLSHGQRKVLDRGGWWVGCGAVAPRKPALEGLIQRGLVRVVRRPARNETGYVSEYEVPDVVRLEWEAFKAGQPA